ncbi:hypothetical protein KEC55_28475 [Burkholderia cepacia]|uniref:hypothetical protein n=1 Tax=Burkholderia cepacia TaxID=292 RepID=UPI00249DC67C|nr:hypothetical protein [Burkholderia cepacia]WGY70950.1 hypothetical protein KEC55_28475 [Burkholderia cepacia]
MIPAPIFSGAFFIVLGISFLATVSVLVWAVALAVFPRARRAFRAHWIRWSVLLGVLCWAGSLFVALAIGCLQIELESRKAETAKHPVLEKPVHLLGIDMPPATKLSLYTAGNMASLTAAEFPHTVSVYGIPAVALTVGAEFDDEAPWNNQRPTMLTALALAISGPRSLDGWTCDTGGEPMRIVLRNDARIKTLWRCRLAEGNRAGDSVIPAGSTLMRSTTTYGDGLHDNDYWRVDVSEGSMFELDRLSLRHPSLNLDRQHRVLSFDSTTLARAASVGNITYPAGTEVSSARRGLREKYPGAWVFTPAPGQAAVSKTDGAIADDTSVVQAPSGTVYVRLRNRAQ